MKYTKTEALAYILERIKDKDSARKCLAAVIYKTCDPAKLEKEMDKWKSQTPANTSPSHTPATPPVSKPKDVQKAQPASQPKAERDWDDFTENL
jgi:hypothetical protein